MLQTFRARPLIPTLLIYVFTQTCIPHLISNNKHIAGVRERPGRPRPRRPAVVVPHRHQPRAGRPARQQPCGSKPRDERTRLAGPFARGVYSLPTPQSPLENLSNRARARANHPDPPTLLTRLVLIVRSKPAVPIVVHCGYIHFGGAFASALRADGMRAPRKPTRINHNTTPLAPGLRFAMLLPRPSPPPTLPSPRRPFARLELWCRYLDHHSLSRPCELLLLASAC
jgi:hypothetical protein